jgi:peptide/nickel transport system permease protein
MMTIGRTWHVLVHALLVLCLVGAVFAPWMAPHPLTQSSGVAALSDALLPPAWLPGGDARFWLGTDEQGRDVLSALLFGVRISLVVSMVSVVMAVLFGIFLGLVSGYFGGWLDVLLMRLCDVMLSFPPILVALLIDGVGHALLPKSSEGLALGVLIFSMAITQWVPYARTVRGLVQVERGKDYVLAARVTGVSATRIIRRHVLPNVLGPVWVLATVQIATAILTEATLSFLGVGVPPTSPSLGTFIQQGNQQLFSGAWWLVVFPGAVLVMLTLGLNRVGDAWRDRLDPALR